MAKTDCRKALESVLEELVQLDSGMKNGRVLPESERLAVYSDLCSVAKRKFEEFSSIDGDTARKWLNGLAVWQKPRHLDLASWKTSAVAAQVPQAILPTPEELGIADVFGCTILDDDGVVVIASQSALRLRYRNQSFDYDFPRHLLEGMAAHELLCWTTGGAPGEHSISVELVTNIVAFNSISGTNVSTDVWLTVLPEDLLLVLAYSQFTSGSAAGGHYDLRAGLGAGFLVPPGRYCGRVVRVGPVLNERLEGISFRLLLCRSTVEPTLELNPDGDERDLPGWHQK